MNSYMIGIEVKDGEIKEILSELSKAQEKIYECYNRLTNIGIVTIRNEADSDD